MCPLHRRIFLELPRLVDICLGCSVTLEVVTLDAQSSWWRWWNPRWCPCRWLLRKPALCVVPRASARLRAPPRASARLRTPPHACTPPRACAPPRACVFFLDQLVRGIDKLRGRKNTWCSTTIALGEQLFRDCDQLRKPGLCVTTSEYVKCRVFNSSRP